MEKDDMTVHNIIMKTLKVVPKAYDMHGENFNCDCHMELTDETYKLIGKTFNVGSDFKSMIRTRVIITYGGEANKYNIKILSEITKPESNCARSANDYNNGSKSASLTATNDECFEPVDRILRKYSDLISEIQRRFK